MPDFTTPLHCTTSFPELIKFDDLARPQCRRRRRQCALLVKDLVAVRELRDFCCNHSKGGETVTLQACAPFVGGVLRRAEAKFHAVVCMLHFYMYAFIAAISYLL